MPSSATPWRGVHTAIVTPFAPDGTIDLGALETLCGRQLDDGIHGLVACGTTGETPTLSSDEWADVVALTVRVAGGRVPVTAGVGTNNTASTVRNLERAAALGADAGLLVLPYYNKPNPNGLRAHVRAAAAVGLPIVLYNIPGRTAQPIAAPLLCELLATDGVVAVKEATGDVKFATDVLLGADVAMLSGDDFTFLPLMAAGGHGVISVVSNVAPAHTVAVYEAWMRGDAAAATTAFQRLWPLITWLFTESNPVPCKAALAQLGLCRPDVRLPLAAFSGAAPNAMLHALGLS